jgi:hypothetical protein
MDAAHELGHIVLHRRCPAPKSDKDPRHKLMETQAFRFATSFLLPSESFANDIFVCNLEELLAIKPKWRVSVAAMITRAAQLDLIAADQHARLRRTYSNRKWKRREPFDDEWIPEQPVFLRRSLELVLGAGVASADSIVNDVRLPATDIEDLTGLPRGTLSDGPLPLSFRSSEEAGRAGNDGIIVPFRTSTEPRTLGRLAE